MSIFREAVKPSGHGNDDGLQNVLSNLTHVLNTKRGYGSFLHDFGISDLNEYTGRDALIVRIMGEVQRNIEYYEPRLQLIDIVVKENNDPFRICFDIRCVLKDTQRALVMEFNSVLNNFRIEKGMQGRSDV